MVLLAGLVACSPALNWREVMPPGAALSALFPCKPGDVLRQVGVAKWRVALHLVSCDAQGQVFALAYSDMPLGASPVEVLAALRDATAVNVGAGQGTVVPDWRAPGLAAASVVQRLRWRGVRADGSALVLEVAYFATGHHAYQASIVSSSIDPEAAEMFFSGLRLTP